MKSKKCHPNHSNMIYSSLVHPSGLSGKLDLTANSDFSGISSPPTHGACAWNTQLRRRPQPRPDLCGCPPTPGPPGDARGRAGAHGQVSRGGELRLLRGREGPPGPRPGPTLSTRSPQLPGGPKAARPGMGLRAWREEARALTLPPTSRGHPGEASRHGCHDTKATLRASDLGHRSAAKQGTPARMQAGALQTGARRGTVRACAPPLPAPGLRPRLRAPGLSRRSSRPEGTGSALSGRERGEARRHAPLCGGSRRLGRRVGRSPGALATALRMRPQGRLQEGKNEPPRAGRGGSGRKASGFPEGAGLMAMALDSNCCRELSAWECCERLPRPLVLFVCLF